MSNIYNTPHEFDQTDPAGIKSQEIFADKQNRMIEFRNLRVLPERIARFFLFLLFEELIDESFGKKKEQKGAATANLTEILKTFSSKLEVLMHHNESQNFHFVQELSDLWHEIIDYIDQCDLLMQPPKHVEPLKSLLKQIFQYPKKSDHSFGYYLNEYAGEKWLPFPFMDLLNELHEDALVNGQKSILADWRKAIDLILMPL